MKTCFLSIWRVIDPIYFFFSRLTLIDDEQKCVFRVRLTKYKGHHVVLSDGTHIRKNDVLVKIHLHNIKLVRELQSIESAVRKGIIIYQKVYQSMPMLLEYINNHKKSEKIKGIIGITMLDKGVERLGFDVVTPVNPFYRSSELPKFTEFILFVYLERKASAHLSNKRLMPWSAQSF
jgi:hypothetical protein